MKKKGIKEELVESGLAAIDNSDYLQTLDTLLQKKWKLLQARNIAKVKRNKAQSPASERELKMKVAAFAIQKGYETELVLGRLKMLF